MIWVPVMVVRPAEHRHPVRLRISLLPMIAAQRLLSSVMSLDVHGDGVVPDVLDGAVHHPDEA
jgi:hypothetical protein